MQEPRPAQEAVDAAPRAPALALVKHLRGEGFTVVDTDSEQSVNQVGEGRQPHTIAVHPRKRWAYVPYMASNSLEVVDLHRLEVEQTVDDALEAPVGAALTRSGRHLLVSAYGSLAEEEGSGIAVFEIEADGGVSKTGELPVGKAAGIVVDAADTVWIALKEEDEILHLDGKPPFTELDRWGVPGDPQDISFAEEYGLLGVNNVEDGSVTFFDTLEGRRLATVPAPNPRGGTAVPASDQWFVGDTEGTGVTAIDVEEVRAADDENLSDASGEVETGSSTAFTDASPDGALVVVDAYEDNRVTFIDPRTLEVLEKVRTGGTPHHPRFTVDGRRCYVPNEDDDTVSVLDTSDVDGDGVSHAGEIQLPDGVAPSGFYLTGRR